ncbi:MAG TPA: alpha/beta fold hydrolase [Myxococcales bacterium]|nr:alpha/beta fold hydrolase [Myxococcales bacterium]
MLALPALVALACALPQKPDPPHTYFQKPDHFLVIDSPALYPKPLRVRYKDVGAGPPLLLVHGLQTSSYSWRYVLDLLSQGHHVIAPDLVGSGLSDHPADFGYSAEHMADFLEAFRAALEQIDPSFARWDVVGNSLGGAYTAAYAARHPERVAHLVIIHAPGFMDRAPILGLELLRRGDVPEAAARFFGPWMVRAFQRYHRPGLLSEEEVAEYARPYADLEGRRAFWHIVREGLSPEAAARLPAVLAAIKAPTLLIWAENDTLIPPWTGWRWQHAIAGSQIAWVPQSSHFPQVEAPERTSSLILSFLGPPPAAAK